MRVNVFTSPIGLGHAARDIAIARRMAPGPRFTAGGAAAELLRMAGMGVRDAYPVPELPVRGGALGGMAGWLLGYYRHYRRCRGIARRIIRDDGPSAVVGDEDLASLAEAQAAGIPTAMVTDVLGTSFTRWPASVLEGATNAGMRRIMGRCDLVIVPEEGEDSGNVRRVGPIVRGTPHAREELRRRLGFEGRTVLVTAGGTGAGGFLVEAALGAAPGIDAELVVAPGPRLRGGFPGARDMGFVADLHEAVYAADAVVSLAGRSTMDEARAYGTPGVFIPIRGHFEQEANAAAAGFAHGDVCRLGELVSAKLAEGRAPVRAGGAEEAARLVLGLGST